MGRLSLGVTHYRWVYFFVEISSIGMEEMETTMETTIGIRFHKIIEFYLTGEL